MGDNVQKTWEKYPAALPEGSILAGQYTIRDVLGQGGFGITYLAEDYKLKTKVAVKEFFPESMVMRQGGIPQVTVYNGGKLENFHYGMQCFLDEARVLAQFQGNPNIVGVRSYFEENDTAYFVMDYIEGINLKTYIQRHGGKLGWDEACGILLPVMDALVEVHRQGFIHRDVTPDNILIANDHTVKLLDFGAARYSIGDRSQSLDVVLKAGYAPKEQYTRRGKQGPYTDVYSVAACFYAALCGYLPPESLDRMDRDEIIPLSARGVQLPQSAERAILKGLAVRAEDRFQSMDEFKYALTATGDTVLDSKPDSNLRQTGVMEKIKRFVKDYRVVVTIVGAVVVLSAIVLWGSGAGDEEPVNNHYEKEGGSTEIVLQDQSAGGSTIPVPEIGKTEEAAEDAEENMAVKKREEEKQCADFIAAGLDALFRNELEDYITQGIGTEETVAEIRENLINLCMDVLLSGYEEDDFPEEFALIEENLSEMLCKAQYTVKSAEKQDDGSYIVTVTYTKMRFFEPLKGVYSKSIINMIDYWMEDEETIFPSEKLESAMLIFMGKSMGNVLEDIKYAELDEKCVRVKKSEDGFSIDDDEIDGVGELIMNFFDFENIDGLGTVVYDENEKFIGVWEEEKSDGYGLYIWSGGDKYIGRVKDAYMEENGFYSWPNGDWYLGGFKKGNCEGYGVRLYTNEYLYAGDWENDEQNGYGLCVYANGDSYQGEWKDGKRNGHGKYIFEDGREYEGEWEDDEMVE